MVHGLRVLVSDATTALTGIEDPAELRRAFTLYPRGVMAVAALVDGEQVGLAVSAFVSVSLDPPLILICVDRESRTTVTHRQRTAVRFNYDGPCLRSAPVEVEFNRDWRTFSVAQRQVGSDRRGLVCRK